MATITITNIRPVEIDGAVIGRHAEFIISDEVDEYLWSDGSVPAEGDEQAYLDGRFDLLWAAASAKAISVPEEVTFRQEARQFMTDNPNARLLIELDLASLETAIETRSAGQETLLLKTLAVAVRYLYERDRLK